MLIRHVFLTALCYVSLLPSLSTSLFLSSSLFLSFIYSFFLSLLGGVYALLGSFPLCQTRARAENRLAENEEIM